jgi:hypothetical protein
MTIRMTSDLVQSQPFTASPKLRLKKQQKDEIRSESSANLKEKKPESRKNQPLRKMTPHQSHKPPQSDTQKSTTS